MCVCHCVRVLFVSRFRIAVNDECVPLVFASPSEPFKKKVILLHQCQLMPFLLLYTVAEISLGPLFHPSIHPYTTGAIFRIQVFVCVCLTILSTSFHHTLFSFFLRLFSRPFVCVCVLN